MSKAKLKKYLATLTKEQLIEVITELYDARKEACDYLEFFMQPDAKSELEKARKNLWRTYFTPQGKGRPRPDKKNGSEIVKNFVSLGTEPEMNADIYLYHAELVVCWLVIRRVASKTAWDTLVNIFGKAAEAITSYDYTENFRRRIDKVLDYSGYAPEELRVEARLREQLENDVKTDPV